MIVSDREVKLKTPNNRFLLVMSIINVVQSIAYAFSVLPLPRSSGTYAAIGNDLTCSIQGFIVQMGLLVPCYNACLCIWYLKSIKYNMTAEEFQQRFEPYCHAVSLLAPFIFATVLACFDKYAPRGYLCWVAEDDKYQSLISLLTGIFPFTSFIIIVYCLSSIHRSFVLLERQAQEHFTSGAASGVSWQQSNPNLNRKKKAAKQSLLFSCSFFITFFSVPLTFFLANG